MTLFLFRALLSIKKKGLRRCLLPRAIFIFQMESVDISFRKEAWNLVDKLELLSLNVQTTIVGLGRERFRNRLIRQN